MPTLETVAAHLGSQSYAWEIIVVDDGSSDATASLVSEWASEGRNTRLEKIAHAGKGWAVRHGMLKAEGELRFMCDADLAMPIAMLDTFIERMGEGYDIVIGSRQIAGARRFDEPMMRHVMGRVFNWSVRLLAVGGFQDTQCGFKCFKGDVADALFQRQTTRGFGFDVEILYMAAKRRLRVLEIPIDWRHKRASKIRFAVDSFLMLRDTARVRWNGLRGKYDAASVSARPSLSVNGSAPADWRPSADELVAIVVPTYNEASNLPRLAERLFALGIPNVRLIVVDDSSPDGTAQVAKELSQRLGGRLAVIERPGKQGLGTAYKEGFSRALQENAQYVLQMDADLSHAPEYVPALIGQLRQADVVVGSRYVKGGGVDEKWSLKRRTLSYFANLGIRMAAGLRVKDATSGFKAYRASVLRSLRMAEFRCRGFGFQAEVAYACQRQGYRVVEYPIEFHDRTEGKSKMSLHIAFEALWRLLLLRWRRRG